MYYFIIELQTREDGVVNNSITTRSSLATALALYYQRASAAVTSQFVSVSLMLIDQDATILKNERFETLYEPAGE